MKFIDNKVKRKYKIYREKVEAANILFNTLKNMGCYTWIPNIKQQKTLNYICDYCGYKAHYVSFGICPSCGSLDSIVSV